MTGWVRWNWPACDGRGRWRPDDWSCDGLWFSCGLNSFEPWAFILETRNGNALPELCFQRDRHGCEEEIDQEDCKTENRKIRCQGAGEIPVHARLHGHSRAQRQAARRQGQEAALCDPETCRHQAALRFPAGTERHLPLLG